MSSAGPIASHRKARAPRSRRSAHSPHAHSTAASSPELVLEGARVVEQPLPGEERGLIGLRGLLERAVADLQGHADQPGPVPRQRHRGGDEEGQPDQPEAAAGLAAPAGGDDLVQERPEHVHRIRGLRQQTEAQHEAERHGPRAGETRRSGAARRASPRPSRPAADRAGSSAASTRRRARCRRRRPRGGPTARPRGRGPRRRSRRGPRRGRPA